MQNNLSENWIQGFISYDLGLSTISRFAKQRLHSRNDTIGTSIMQLCGIRSSSRIQTQCERSGVTLDQMLLALSKWLNFLGNDQELVFEVIFFRPFEIPGTYMKCFIKIEKDLINNFFCQKAKKILWDIFHFS